MRLIKVRSRLSEFLILAAIQVIFCSGACAQGRNDLAILNGRIGELYNTGQYSEAIPLAEKSLAMTRSQVGDDHPEMAERMGWLALLYEIQGRYLDAEPLFKRSLAIELKIFGPDHPHSVAALNNLALLYKHQGRLAEAEPLYRQSLALREKAFGPDHPEVGAALNNLGALYRTQGRFADAEQMYKRDLAIAEKALGPNHPDVANSLNNLAELYRAQGRYTEGEPLLKRSLAISEKALGPDHPAVGTSLNNLAGLYEDQGRFREAEPLYKRDLSIKEKAFGAYHPLVGTALNNLAALYLAEGRFAEAESLQQRDLLLSLKAFGPANPQVGTALMNLAAQYRSQGRFVQAEAMYKKGIFVIETSLGPNHPELGIALNNLAELYRNEGRYGEAEPLYTRAIAISENALGPEHPFVGTALNNLALHYFVQKNWSSAIAPWRRSAALTARRVLRDATAPANRSGGAKTEAEQVNFRFFGLVKVLYRLAAAQGDGDGKLATEAFEAAQWAKSSQAAVSLTQMAARGAVGNSSLSQVTRERQDLLAEWQARDRIRIEAISKGPAQRDPKSEAANVEKLAAIDVRIAQIDKQLAVAFPAFAALASPVPLTVADVQTALHADEVLVLFLDTPEWKPTPDETFIWVVTKTEMRWVRSDLGTAGLVREVAALRCGLDYSGAWLAKNSQCRELTEVNYNQKDANDGKPLPFDSDRSNKLYKTLFGQVEDLTKSKSLLVVPSGPLTQLPFQVLVTTPPRGSSYSLVTWLAREHALTVLPAVTSLKALRGISKPSSAKLPMIGFGNPLLNGPDASYAASAQSARDKQRCPETLGERIANLIGLRSGGIEPIAMIGGLADVTQIRSQVPLPETADEVCAVARDLRADVREMRLGASATEHEIKSMSASGALAKYRIVHFATHGALAGQLRGTREPGLILTPPATPTDDDDGYLSASDIAGLRLDADLVILSACNTAAAGSDSAEALSGLARAFFYAQARALLVSHWAVNSDATVKLITTAVVELARDKTVGRAEALRRAMLAMIDHGKPYEAHPTYWAPFVVVGEGAAAK